MSDFGTAAIFFVTFLVIAYMRSGDFATLSLICGGAVFGAGIISEVQALYPQPLRLLGPRLGGRLAASGYQQTRTMSAAASGGLLGMGAGEGWLHNVARGGHRPGVRYAVRGVGAADRPCWRWASIITSGVVRRHGPAGSGGQLFTPSPPARPPSLLVFQTCLNVFGAGGPAAPHRRHVPLCVQRRLGYDVRVGAAGLS
ncbi:MAG: hypothetical protein ACLRWQ_10720 [Flavonifractor plautii]